MIALTPVPETAHQLSVVWGLHSVVLDADLANTTDMTRKACRIAFSHGFAKAGEGILITGGVPLGTPGTTRLSILSPEEDEAMLREAGFSDVSLFYAGLSFRGWVGYA